MVSEVSYRPRGFLSLSFSEMWEYRPVGRGGTIALVRPVQLVNDTSTLVFMGTGDVVIDCSVVTEISIVAKKLVEGYTVLSLRGATRTEQSVLHVIALEVSIHSRHPPHEIDARSWCTSPLPHARSV